MPERASGRTPLPTTRMRGTTRELYEFTRPGECLLVGRSIAPELADLRELALWLSGLGSGVLMLGLVGGWWVATRAIRSIKDISATATKIATGDLSHRINTDDTDNELGQLAAVLNSTFARLESSFERQRQFTADASHELRTPVAVILSQAQTTLARDRGADEYREALEACQRAAQRMRRLTDSLLELARLDAAEASLLREHCDLAPIAEECLQAIRPLSEEKTIQLNTDLKPAPCLGDAGRLAQVVTNLVTNAVHHNKAGEHIRVTTGQEGDWVVLVVADTGPGIAPEDLPHLFERFYRADKSRQGGGGGTGLGLTISRAIVEAHGGTIDATSNEGKGATFTIRLPAQRN